MVTLLLLLLGPDTEVLIVSKACGPCVKAIKIIEQLQDEGYDVVIKYKKDCKDIEVKTTPTLIVRKRGSLPKWVTGLQTEKTYRKLISLCH